MGASSVLSNPFVCTIKRVMLVSGHFRERMSVLVVSPFEDFILVDHDLNKADLSSSEDVRHTVTFIIRLLVSFAVHTRDVVVGTASSMRAILQELRISKRSFAFRIVFIVFRFVGLPVDVVDHHHVWQFDDDRQYGVREPAEKPTKRRHMIVVPIKEED